MHTQCPHCNTKFYGWSSLIQCDCGWETTLDPPLSKGISYLHITYSAQKSSALKSLSELNNTELPKTA